MSGNFSIKVTKDGVSATPIQSEQQRNSKMDEIIRQINDENAPLAPIKRLIAAELAAVNSTIMQTVGEHGDVYDAIKIKALEAQIKALRELGKELMESDVLSKKDFLNFDGPKLAYVLEEFRQGASDSLKKIGIDEGTIQQFLRHWRDVMLERETQIRRSTEKLEFDEKKKQ